MPTFDAAAVDCQVLVFREGLLTSVGHDVTFQVASLSLEVGDDDAITADFDAGSLRDEVGSATEQFRGQRRGQRHCDKRRSCGPGDRKISPA